MLKIVSKVLSSDMFLFYFFKLQKVDENCKLKMNAKRMIVRQLSYENIIIMMYWDNQIQLQMALNNDWAVLIKNVKLREELHWQVLQANKKIISKSRNQDDQHQNDEELQQFQQELRMIVQSFSQIQQQQKEIVAKYENFSTSIEGVIKLMERVGAKVLSIAQNSHQRLKQLDQSLIEKHESMKRNLIGLLSQRQQLNLENVINVVLDYSRGKVQRELFKLEKLVQALELKEYYKLKQIYNPREKISSFQKIISSFFIERRKELSAIKEGEEIKQISPLRKKTSKVMQNLYNIMILSKNQFNDELIGTFEERAERLVQDLLSKNKYNSEQIVKFCQQQHEFTQKVRNFQEELLKPTSPQINQPKAKSYTQVLNKKPKVPQAIGPIMLSKHLTTEVECYPKEQELDQAENVRKKIIIRKKFQCGLDERELQDFPQISNKTIAMQHHESTFRFDSVKKENSSQMNKGRLPGIKGISLDNKFSTIIPKLSTSRGDLKEQINNMEQVILITGRRKQRSFKQDKLVSQRTKMVLKSIEVGTNLNAKREDLGDVLIVKERKKTDSSVMESTAYCKRALNKFLDTKLNAFL